MYSCMSHQHNITPPFPCNPNCEDNVPELPVLVTQPGNVYRAPFYHQPLFSLTLKPHCSSLGVPLADVPMLLPAVPVAAAAVPLTVDVVPLLLIAIVTVCCLDSPLIL